MRRRHAQLASGHPARRWRGLWSALLAALLCAVAPACRAEAAFVTVSPHSEHSVWWARASYHPFGTELRGVPVGKIRSGWCKANEFARELFPRELMQMGDHDLLLDNHLAFSAAGRFDGGRALLTATVGAYETCKGVKGLFLLLWRGNGAGPWKVRYLEEFPGRQGFAALKVADGALQLWWCGWCNYRQELRREGGRFAWTIPPVIPPRTGWY